MLPICVSALRKDSWNDCTILHPYSRGIAEREVWAGRVDDHQVITFVETNVRETGLEPSLFP
jgi:hypothetical protein